MGQDIGCSVEVGEPSDLRAVAAALVSLHAEDLVEVRVSNCTGRALASTSGRHGESLAPTPDAVWAAWPELRDLDDVGLTCRWERPGKFVLELVLHTAGSRRASGPGPRRAYLEPVGPHFYDGDYTARFSDGETVDEGFMARLLLALTERAPVRAARLFDESWDRTPIVHRFVAHSDADGFLRDAEEIVALATRGGRALPHDPWVPYDARRSDPPFEHDPNWIRGAPWQAAAMRRLRVVAPRLAERGVPLHLERAWLHEALAADDACEVRELGPRGLVVCPRDPDEGRVAGAYLALLERLADQAAPRSPAPGLRLQEKGQAGLAVDSDDRVSFETPWFAAPDELATALVAALEPGDVLAGRRESDGSCSVDLGPAPEHALRLDLRRWGASRTLDGEASTRWSLSVSAGAGATVPDRRWLIALVGRIATLARPITAALVPVGGPDDLYGRSALFHSDPADFARDAFAGLVVGVRGGKAFDAREGAERDVGSLIDEPSAAPAWFRALPGDERERLRVRLERFRSARIVEAGLGLTRDMIEEAFARSGLYEVQIDASGDVLVHGRDPQVRTPLVHGLLDLFFVIVESFPRVAEIDPRHRGSSSGSRPTSGSASPHEP